jgi:hypothetical protein
MKCEEVDIRIVDFLDKNLGESEMREIEAHLETCERCFDEVRNFQHLLKVISEEEVVKPDDSLRINFYHMLHKEIESVKPAGILPGRRTAKARINLNRYSIAAGIALLICGTFLGGFTRSGIFGLRRNDELRQLQSEVTLLKQTVMFSMLNEESSSNRLQAVNYVTELKNPDNAVIEVLVKTLNYDKNVNVRMAAAYALAKFTDQRAVCDSLVSSLSNQTDPILQVTLIDILVDIKESSALQPIQRIMYDKNTLDAVKTVAENGVRSLI